MLKYIVLGIIQGLTEFLPVSSSGHLVIMQKILGITVEEVTVSIVFHLGTILALVIFFLRDILNLVHNIKQLSLIVVVTIITGIIGLAGRDFFKTLFSCPKLVAIALILTGTLLIMTKKFMNVKRNNVNFKDAFILGIAQAIAIIPGISRSGITISTLILRGIDKETSFKFSFLASIPAVLGATVLEAKNICLALNLEFTNFFAGFISSFLTGLLSLWLLKIILKKAKLYYFGYYCIAVAIITLLFIK